ncbi:MAG TPA: serine hydrolase domain-containing protein [Candidatus Acidoferrales bacterium]|jgi:D-alanyl-D-alanine carboxypeptidase|nr:serine hydrolase domain-containing protein [Candidatus Acidoferrales bacterium]
MIRRIILCLLVGGSICLADDRKDDLHAYFVRSCESHKFMGAASVTVNGETKFAEACGWADAEWKVGNTTDTRFRAGSIAKQFTAAAVLLLYQDGRISLSDPIGKYLPDLPDSWRPATIHQLLTHTSGVPIPDYDALFKLYPLGPTPTQMVALLRDNPLLYPHGTRLTYNNVGYILLGFLIEKISGIEYERFVQERLFDQLGMRESGFDDIHKIVPRRARGYALDGAGMRNADPIDPRWAWSAGGFYSTVHDLTVWSEALAQGKLLNPDSTKRMFTIYSETLLEGMHYGYGVVLTERFGHELQYHGGGIRGFTSVLQRYPQVNLVIAVMSNLDSDTTPPPIDSWVVGDGLAKIWFHSQSQ